MSTKRLFRSRRDGLIAGVCSGLADYFDVDPSLVRLIVVLTILLGGAGLVLYIVAWLIVPENPEQGSSATSTSYEKNQKLKDEVVDELRRLGSDMAEKLEDSIEELEGHPERRSMVFLGLAFIVVGGAFLFRRFMPWLDLEELWPILLIAVGILLLVGAARRAKGS